MKKISSFILVLACLFIGFNYVHAITPTASQIEQFKKLPRAQQEMIAKQYGIDLSSIEESSQAVQMLETPELVVSSKEKSETTKQAETKIENSVNNFSERDDKNSYDSISHESKDGEKLNYKEELIGGDRLKQFGYELFEGSPTTFAPATDIPIPTDYIVGPGDTVKIQLLGKSTGQYEMPIDREGRLNLPELDVINVIGMSFDELKQMINEQYSTKAIGIKPIISLGELRSIRIFMLGEVNNPGAYTVSSLARLTHALFVSGGISKIGSLRNIQLKRNGKLVSEFDYYDLLLKGDISKDQRLMPNDVIYVPPIGNTIGITGEVKRAAIYEVKPSETFSDVINMAGGLLASAYPQISRIDRVDSTGQRIVVNVDFTNKVALMQKGINGDVINIFSVLNRVENRVKLSGHVHRPGVYAWHKGYRISDLLRTIESLLPKADLNYSLIKREKYPTREIELLQFNLSEALKYPESENNMELNARDEVIIFGIETDRSEVLEETITQLQAQERVDLPIQIITVHGNVRYPGIFPYTLNMTVQDAIHASFDLNRETDFNYAFILRKIDKYAKYEALTINLLDSKYLNLKLKAEDQLFIFDLSSRRTDLLTKAIEKLNRQADKQFPANIVSVYGEVKHPGTYPLSKGMKPRDLISAAGGLTESAFMEKAEITRFKTDLFADAKKEHFQFHLKKELKESNVDLISRDVLNIQRIPEWRETQYVSLSGEFKFPGRYEIKEGDGLRDIIDRAGGFTEYAAINGVVFSRKELREKENIQIGFLKQKLQEDILQKSIENSNAIDLKGSRDTSNFEQLFEQLDNRANQGRLALDLAKIINNRKKDIELRDGDSIHIPKTKSEVSIIGQVQQNISILFDDVLSVEDYIKHAGGLTSNADEDRIYIVKLSGEIVSFEENIWFSNDAHVEPGDTIVVPVDADKVDNLTLWTSISQVVYQFGVAAAAITAL